MDTIIPPFQMPSGRPGPGQSQRRHRFMESADIAAAFRELFGPLRANVRRGMTNEGQLYALEMDPCIPGELLGSVWLALEPLGIDSPAALADTARRRAALATLLSQPRPEALFAYVSERSSRGPRPVPMLYVEIASADACYAAEHLIHRGRGWYRRELAPAQHRRLGPMALA